jgi:uncharacterized membrane protein
MCSYSPPPIPCTTPPAIWPLTTLGLTITPPSSLTTSREMLTAPETRSVTHAPHSRRQRVAEPGGSVTMSKLDIEDHERQPPYEPHDTQHSPVVLYQLRKRADDWQLHLADRITAFAGSMLFVWVHVALFALWIASGLFGADRYPFQFLTFIVSLEAIFLSTFVMIGQNRQAVFQQAKADHDFHTAETDLKENTELTRAIHALTQEIRATTLEMRQKLGEDAPPVSA